MSPTMLRRLGSSVLLAQGEASRERSEKKGRQATSPEEESNELDNP